MKAFQYLAALSLGAVVTLGDASWPAVAQTESAEVSSDGITPNDVAINNDVTTNDIISEEASAQVVASAIALIPKAPSQPQLDLSSKVAVSAAPPTEEPAIAPAIAQTTEAEKVPGVDGPAEEVVQPAAPRPGAPAPESPIPVNSGSVDPVEAEFEQEDNLTPSSTSSETDEEVPADSLTDAMGDETDKTMESDASMAEKMTDEEGVVTESSAPATTLVDEQPNLFRPDESSEVSIEVNEPISLETAIEIARQNSPSIRVRQLQFEQSQTAIDEARAAYAPQFSVNGSFDNTGTFSDINEYYREPGGEDDRSARDAVVSLNGNARVDYGIIDPDRKARVEAAEIAAKQARLTLEQDLSQLRLNVSQAYYQLQEADEQVKISEQAVVSAQRSLKDARALEQAGVGTRFSVLQADVQLANEQQNLVNNLSDQQKSRRQLAQILSTPEKLNLTASDPVASAGSWTMTLEQSIVRSYANRVELDNQLLQRDLSDAQRRIALSATRPSLTAFAQAGPGLRWNFNRTMRDDSDDTTLGARQGTLGYQAGLQFQWLFGDGGASKAAARQQALNKAIADENFEVARDQVRREVEDAFYDLAANLRNIATSEQGVVQADEALRLARLRFQAGVGTQSEVVDAERDLTTARGNRVSAILNYNRALVAMQRAIGETLTPPTLEIPAYVDDRD